MIVVSDTTAISNLLTVGQADLLQLLFGRVLIPPAVFAELLVWHERLPGWIEVVTVQDAERVARYRNSVHAGEAEAIALAVEMNPKWLLIDDSEGRRLAKREGAPVLGLMGALLMAKDQGLLVEVRPLIERLREEAGFFLSDRVYEEILEMAGER